MAKHYEESEVRLEDFEWGDECCLLTVRAEYTYTDGTKAYGFDPPDDPELELTRLTVTGALVGPDRLEATPEQLKAIQKQLRSDLSAWHRVDELVCAQIS